MNQTKIIVHQACMHLYPFLFPFITLYSLQNYDAAISPPILIKNRILDNVQMKQQL
jgi:hypothetical protein